MALSAESDHSVRLTSADLKGPRHSFYDSLPPDYDQVVIGLKHSGAYSEEEWALGPNKSPVVVDIQRTQDKVDYKFWISGESQPTVLSINDRQGLLAALRESALGSLLRLNNFDSVSPMLIKYPFSQTVGSNGNKMNLNIADGSECRVLIGFKEIDSAGGQAGPGSSQTLFSRS